QFVGAAALFGGAAELQRDLSLASDRRGGVGELKFRNREAGRVSAVDERQRRRAGAADVLAIQVDLVGRVGGPAFQRDDAIGGREIGRRLAVGESGNDP